MILKVSDSFWLILAVNDGLGWILIGLDKSYFILTGVMTDPDTYWYFLNGPDRKWQVLMVLQVLQVLINYDSWRWFRKFHNTPDLMVLKAMSGSLKDLKGKVPKTSWGWGCMVLKYLNVPGNQVLCAWHSPCVNQAIWTCTFLFADPETYDYVKRWFYD